MMRRLVFQMFVNILVFFAAAVRSITRCPAQGPYKSYTCPRLFDPPDRTRCCFWNGPTCCLPGGSTCTDNAAHIRNYCPGPNDGDSDRVCCTVNNKAKCCNVGLVAGIISGALVVAAGVALAVCWFSPKCPLNKYRKRRHMQNVAAAAAAPPPPGVSQWPPGYN